MMPWFFRDPERLNIERLGIEELTRSAEWLIGTEWNLDGGLYLDAVIRAHDHDFEVRVSFPPLYPDAPAVIRPQNMESRISTHQYGGADGPLCLDWGPDNWHRDITAAQMLESAYRLFDIENPFGGDSPESHVVAPSRHQLTVGQQLRGEWIRWYASKTLYDYFASQPENSSGIFKFSLRKRDKTWVSLIHEAMVFGGSHWNDEQIPTTLPEAGASDLKAGIWFKTNLEKKDIEQSKKLRDLQELLASMEEAKFLSTDGSFPVDGFGKSIVAVIIEDNIGELHLLIVFPDEDLMVCPKVRSEDVPVQARSPECNELNGKTIGIVGLGSAGSKIAISLARMGSRKFYLLDHDLLLPENLQRHALDWQGVLLHKVDAMKVAIDLVAPGAQVETCGLHITGQESNAAINGALSLLAACDILIDATADTRVFNLLSAVARTYRLPMIWMEVFGGGIGGLVARSRPRIDPTPQDMRRAYLQYCTANPSPGSDRVLGNYISENEDGDVIVASDADVAILAHHAARLVPDCFANPERLKFPYSMYLIGLAKGWVFEAPFATIPISMASYTASGWEIDNKPELEQEGIQFLLGLIEKSGNATDSTS